METSLRVIRVLEKLEMHEKGTSNMSTRTSTMSTRLLSKEALLKLKMIGYWVTTIIVTLELLAGGVTDLIHGPTLLFAGDPIVLVLAQLGYPVYLLTILGVWKLLGAIALLVPRFPRLKEWAYAGTFFVYVGATASWVARGGGMGDLIGPLILAALTFASWALRPPGRTLGVLLQARAHA
jgi:uncharacterized membrane protein YphA (DoxX/SURF4 family)